MCLLRPGLRSVQSIQSFLHREREMNTKIVALILLMQYKSEYDSIELLYSCGQDVRLVFGD